MYAPCKSTAMPPAQKRVLDTLPPSHVLQPPASRAPAYACLLYLALDLQGVFIGAIVLLYVVIYLPIIHKMDVTIKRSRSMLLLFPGEVVHSVAAIRNTMASYAKSVGTSTQF